LTENVIKQADYFIDLHGGDLIEALVPFTIFPEAGDSSVDKASLELAEVFGIKYLVRKVGNAGSTFSAVAGGGTPAILVESGGQGIWPRKDVELLVNGVNRIMRQYDMLDGGKPEKVETIVLQDFLWQRSDHTGFWYPAIEVGEDVQKDQDLGKITDVWGNTLQTVPATATGRVLFLVSSLAINNGDPLLAIGA
jgi:predicted deacylase